MVLNSFLFFNIYFLYNVYISSVTIYLGILLYFFSF